MDTHRAAAIDFHDADLRSIDILQPSTAIFEFDNVTVYCTTDANDVFEVWKIQARLICRGISQFQLNGRLVEGVSVWQGFFFNDENKDCQLIPIGKHIPITSLRLTIGACEIRASLSSAVLELSTVQGRDEDWIGPLTSG